MDHVLTLIIIGSAIALFTLGYIIGGATTTTTTITNTTTTPLQCPICRACPPEKICENKCPICPKAPECPTCPEAPNCPTCPQCPAQTITSNRCEWLLDYKCNLWESAGPQYGCTYAWDEISAELGCRNRSRFNPGPKVSMNPNDIYLHGTTSAKNPGQFTFNTFEQYGNECFNLSQYPDENGRKRWSWDAEQAKGSILTVCHI